MKVPTVEAMAKDIAEKAVYEIEYKGKTLHEWVEQILTNDAVPVVRCKDCHYISEYDEYIRDKDEIAHGLWCRLKNHSCEPDDYCSCGYREATT